MGMTVVGIPENLWIYNYITSLFISPMDLNEICRYIPFSTLKNRIEELESVIT